MQLDIDNQKLDKILNDSNKLIKAVGIEMAKMIKRRLNELRAAPNFKAYLDYNIGKTHLLTGNFSGYFGISLNKNYRLIVKPIVNNMTLEELKECKIVNIKGVVDYHGKKDEWLIP